MTLIEAEISITEERKTVNIHSGAIQIENKVKLLSRQAWFYLVYKAMPNLLGKETFILSLPELKESIGYNSRNNKYLKQALKDLVDTTIEWNIFSKNKESWEVNSLLAGCKIENGFCEYAISPFLKRKLANPEMYIKLDLLLANKFKSKHTFALYSLALDYLQIKNNYGEKNLTIAELRKFLGFETSEYTRVVDINKDILKKAEKEINLVTDMNISITPLRTTNRKITGVKLKMSIKKEHLDFYKPKKLTGQVLGNQQTGLFDLEPNLLEAPEDEIKKATKENTKIKVENLELKKFYAEYKIALNTDTVQNKLKEIIEMFHDKFENYLLFLMSYVREESNKKAITSLSGFYIGLLKDDSQLDNYVFYIQKQRENEQNKKHKVKALIENELQNRYEKFISTDFEKYLEKNIDKLESKMIKVIESTIKADNFLYDVIIMKFHNGKIDKTLITASKPLVKPSIVGYLKSYKDELDYKNISFDEWKKQLTEKYLQELETEIEKSLNR